MEPGFIVFILATLAAVIGLTVGGFFMSGSLGTAMVVIGFVGLGVWACFIFWLGMAMNTDT